MRRCSCHLCGPLVAQPCAITWTVIEFPVDLPWCYHKQPKLLHTDRRANLCFWREMPPIIQMRRPHGKGLTIAVRELRKAEERVLLRGISREAL